MISWFLIIILLLLSTLVSPWFWILVLLLGVWKAGQIYFYKGRPWRRIHYPMMRLYSKVAGMETAHSTRENREFEIDRALFQLLRTMKPNWSDEYIHQYIDDCKIKCEEFSDKSLLTDFLQKKYPSAKKDDITKLLEKSREFFNSSDNGIIIRMAIAGIIEEKYGLKHRAEYLVAVMDGNAT